MQEELKEAYRRWYDVLRGNEEKSDAIIWYNEQTKRVLDFSKEIEL